MLAVPSGDPLMMSLELVLCWMCGCMFICVWCADSRRVCVQNYCYTSRTTLAASTSKEEVDMWIWNHRLLH